MHIIQELTDLHGWTVLIKIEILIMAGLFWLASSDKWRVPLFQLEGRAPPTLRSVSATVHWLICWTLLLCYF